MTRPGSTPEAAEGGSWRLSEEHPWPGLGSFAEADREFFHGRERESRDLARMIRQEVLTVLFGRSGLGKSSLLRAGVAPLLRRESFVPVHIRLDHDLRTPPLEDQVEMAMEEVLAAEGIDAPRPVREETLWEYFHKKGCDWWDRDNHLVKPVLIFDQFEELLTGGQESPERAERTASFLLELEDLVENRPPAALQRRFETERGSAGAYDLDRVGYRVVLALREDFLADLEGLRERLRSILRNRYRLLPMTGEQALDVVLEPGGHLVRDEIAVRIVDFVSAPEHARRGEDPTESAGRDRIAGRRVQPALLSVVLRELNNRRIQQGADRISADLVGEGQAEEILERFYERGLKGLGDGVRQFVADALLTSAGNRNRIAEEDALTRPEITPEVISTLIDRRLVQRQRTGGMKWLELTHDRLADVVKVDRAELERRRELAAAAAREREIRRRLARTRRLIAAFAVLLLLAGLGLTAALITRSQLAETNRSLEENRDELEAANRRASTQNDALGDANRRLEARRAELEEKNRELLERAETEAVETVARIREEIAALRPGAGPRVERYLAELAEDAAVFDSDALDRSRALAAALAAEVLCEVGYFEQALESARTALRIAGEQEAAGASADPADPADPADGTAGRAADRAPDRAADRAPDRKERPPSHASLRRIRAVARQALGRALLEIGDLEGAERSFRTALRLAEGAADPDAAPTASEDDVRRVRFLGGVGLGNVHFARYRLQPAQEAYREVLDRLRAEGAYDPYREALVLKELGRSEEQDARALEHFRESDRVLGRLLRDDPGNLRARALASELVYQQGFRATDLLPLWEFRKSFERADAYARTLVELDGGNLAWRYLAAVARRGVGIGLAAEAGSGQSRPEARDRARQSFEEERERTAAILREQPRWAANAFQHAVSLFHLGEHDDDPERTAELYVECARLLEALGERAPGNAEIRRSSAVVEIRLGALRGVDGGLEHYTRAIDWLTGLPPEVRDRPRFAEALAYAHADVARKVHLPAGDRTRALESLREAVRVRAELLDTAPNATRHADLATARRQLGDALLEGGDPEAAAAGYGEAVAALDRGLEHHPGSQTLVERKARLAEQVFAAWREAGDVERALEALRLAAASGRRAFEADPVNYDMYALLERVDDAAVEVEAELARQPEASPAEVVAREIRSEIDPSALLEEEQRIGRSPAPLLPGAWRTLLPEEQAEEIARVPRLAELDRPGGRSGSQDGAPASEVFEIRALPLTFYRDATLYEALLRTSRTSRMSGTSETETTAILAYLRRGDETAVLDGSSSPIHRFNAAEAPILETPAQAAAYLRFFTAALQGEEGNFRIVEETDGQVLFGASDGGWRDEGIKPLRIRERPRAWEASGTIRYSNALFYTILRLYPSGTVEMTVDQPFLAELPIATERYDERGLRLLDTPEVPRLRARVERLTGDRDWEGAVAAQERILEVLEGRWTGEDGGEPPAFRRRLAREHLGLSWYQLHARRFAAALATSEAGLELDPDYLPLDTNRAHALLFLGRTEEAEALYREHLGETVRDRTWQEVVLNDLDRLEEAGLTHPGFERVRELMRTGR